MRREFKPNAAMQDTLLLPISSRLPCSASAIELLEYFLPLPVITQVAAENLRLRMDVQTLKSEMANLQGKLHIAGADANAETERSRVQVLDLRKELDVCKEQKSALSSEIERLKSEWQPAQAVQDEQSKFETAKASLKVGNSRQHFASI